MLLSKILLLSWLLYMAISLLACDFEIMAFDSSYPFMY